MSAIRFSFNGSTQVIGLTFRNLNDWVIIRLHGGDEQRIRCAGFICRYATELMPEGSQAKILAVSVTADENSLRDWTDLAPNEVVLGWRVLQFKENESRWVVYVVVNHVGLPLTALDLNYKPPSKSTLTRVPFLNAT